MSGDTGLIGRQVVSEQKSFWRNPAAAGFAFVFPIMFLIIFSSLNSSDRIPEYGNIKYTEYYVPGILVFSIISACFTNLAMGLVTRRDLGILKRKRSTPLPSWALLGGMVGSSIIVSIILTLITVAIGMVVYGNAAPHHILWILPVLALGAVTFCALGVATTAIVPNADAAPAVVNFIVFPPLFLSGVFFPVNNDTLETIGNLLPIRPFQQALIDSFDPAKAVSHPAFSDVATLAIWGLVGLVLAARFFRWDKTKA
jgi:ABC-2 type transport system permease protein